MDTPIAPPTGTPLPPSGSSSNHDSQDVEKNKDIAAFSYLWIMSIIVFFLRKQSPFVRFHAKQAMLLFALSIIVWFVPFISRVLELIVLAGMVVGFVHAAQGQWKDVPLVGPVSRGEMSVREAWRRIVALIARFGRSAADMAKTPEKTAPPPSTHEPSQPAQSPISNP